MRPRYAQKIFIDEGFVSIGSHRARSQVQDEYNQNQRIPHKASQ